MIEYPQWWEKEVVLAALLPIVGALLAAFSDSIPALAELDPAVVASILVTLLSMGIALIYARVKRSPIEPTN